MEAASHAFLRGYSVQQEIAPSFDYAQDDTKLLLNKIRIFFRTK